MFTTRPELAGTFGMVSTTHWLASQSAMAILEDGGNAFDAAVAAAFVLHVVEPHLNGPGGDLPLIYRKGQADPVVLCGQGVAPAAATIEHFQSLGLDVVPGTGLLAPAVPGSAVAWLTLLRDHGTKTPAEVMRFAIGYAEHGHPLNERVSALIGAMSAYFKEHWPTSARTWMPNGTVPQANDLLTNPALAATYTKLASQSGSREQQCDAAIDAWSQGFVAAAIEGFAATEVMDSSGQRHAGVLTGQDLAAWRPTYEAPLSLDWRGQRVYKCGPWTQGPVLLQQLSILDGLLPEHADDWDAEIIHTAIEAAKLSFADRDAWYGDAFDVDISELLSSAYADTRRALIGVEASLELRPGALGGALPRLPARGTAMRGNSPDDGMAGVGEPTVKRDGLTKGDTCHIDVVDRWGNVVSATPSGGWLQSSPTIPELGFCLGTRLQMVWLEPGLPSSLVPGRRPRTTLSPSMALSERGVTTAFGTPGGDQQDQWQLTFWLAHTMLGRNLQAAVDAPSWHTTALISSFEPRVWTPGGVEIEGRVEPTILADLRARGHVMNVQGDWSLGRMSAASYNPATGLLKAAANPRGMQGYAVGR